MKVEKQVVSLNLAKKLKESGVKQKSLWYYDPTLDNQLFLSDISDKQKEDISAFTVAELGGIISDIYDKDWYSEPFTGIWYCRLHTHNVKDSCTRRVEADTEADARAKMLIWIIENKKVNYE